MSDIDHRSGKLHLVYADHSARPVILAEEEIELGGTAFRAEELIVDHLCVSK